MFSSTPFTKTDIVEYNFFRNIRQLFIGKKYLDFYFTHDYLR